jgi:ABC-type phosphate transport system auxiliary subunit
MTGATSFIVIAVISLLLFLAVRELMAWYWKINTIIKNQEIQIHLLKKIAGVDHRIDDPSIEDKARKYDQMEALKK